LAWHWSLCLNYSYSLEVSTFNKVRLLSLIQLKCADRNRSLHNEALHFWTVFSASFLDFTLFGVVYGLILININKTARDASIPDNRRRRSGVSGSFICCSADALLALVILGAGWKLLWIQSLLLEVSKDENPRLKDSTNIVNKDLSSAHHHAAFTT